MPSTNNAVGEYGEALASRYLTDQDFVVLERNWRCARGEIDIVAVDGDCLVICEVKTRRSLSYGQPFEAVGWHKARRLRSLAHLWSDAHPERPRTRGIRIDVVSILCVPGQPPRIEHLRGVQ